MLTVGGSVSGVGLSFLSDGGDLALSQPSSFAAAISGFATTDTIDVLGTLVTKATFVNNTLTLTGAGGSIGSLSFSGDYSGYNFGVFKDGHGGSIILLV